MRALLTIAALVLAAAVSAEELTVNEVIAAHRAGAPVEGILRLVREASDVAVLTPADLERLRAAGVPDVVVRAMAARHAPPSPTPTAPATRPDDPRLEDVVRLVRAGLSEKLVCEQVRRAGTRRELSANDLVYLKESAVPEAVIAALMEASAPPTPAPTATVPVVPTPAPPPPVLATPTPLPTVAPPVALEFAPLVRMSGTFRKAQAGRLVLTGEGLEWTAAADPARVDRIAASSLRAVWLATGRGGQGSRSELRVRTSAGDDLTFRDADAPGAGGGTVETLYRALKERFPQAILPAKPAR